MVESYPLPLELISNEPKFSGVKFVGRMDNLGRPYFLFAKWIKDKLCYVTTKFYGLETDNESAIHSLSKEAVKGMFWDDIHEIFDNMEKKEGTFNGQTKGQ